MENMSSLDKPCCQACENNKDPILSVIKSLFEYSKAVLEVGSGTGQHAAYFAENLPHLVWYPSDRKESHKGIMLWLKDAALDNLKPPLELDVCQDNWPELSVDAVFSANTVHIMHWDEVAAFFTGISGILPSGGVFALYGPVNYNGQYTSDSNAQFDIWLKNRDPESGIRDFEALDNLANKNGMRLTGDFKMPANNRILCWIKD